MGRELRQLTSLDDARRTLWQSLPERVRQGRFGIRSLPIADAVAHVLDEAVHSPGDLPPFDRAIMDGYAVRAEDTFGASEGLPAYLRVIGEVRMGEAPDFALSPQEAAAIPTGGMLPAGSDAVVMVEHTQPWAENSIEVLRPVAPGDYVVRRGDDAVAGQEILPAGHRLRPHDISALAGLGIECVAVRRPRVGVLSTGSELVPHGDSVSAGQIRDMNGPALRAAAHALGAEPVDLGLVRDDAKALRTALEQGLANADVLLASGGTSVGAEDLLPDVISSLGSPGVLIHGLAVKPGKPVVIGLVGEMPVFGLPGHPTSCLIMFRELVAPLIRAATDPEAERRPPLRARLTRNYRSQAGREELVPVALTKQDGEWTASPILRPSSLISALLAATGLVRIPPSAEGLYEGDVVDVETFE